MYSILRFRAKTTANATKAEIFWPTEASLPGNQPLNSRLNSIPGWKIMIADTVDKRKPITAGNEFSRSSLAASLFVKFEKPRGIPIMLPCGVGSSNFPVYKISRLKSLAHLRLSNRASITDPRPGLALMTTSFSVFDIATTETLSTFRLSLNAIVIGALGSNSLAVIDLLPESRRCSCTSSDSKPAVQRIAR